MPDLALKLDKVSKMYRLGQVGTGTLAHDINRALARIRGKEDPFAQVGLVNDREEAGGDYVWALEDINFEVTQGEIVGIIGRNGAGKSTLLKLLSRVTAPTKGKIFINGRIASLLEVGTGFHPDLTGRENIYLNGAILGMTRKEITARFDEIVAFSGCAKYIDTPVKRYSSGMYVRLAFAVAAHLETDILIVDEVLAVGDAEFQSKCLGKMQDISRNSHRTVLFVSHNMAAVKRLCPRSILMDRGRVVMEGRTPEVIERYLSSGGEADRVLRWPKGEAPGNAELVLESIEVLDAAGRFDTALSTADPIDIKVSYQVLSDLRNLRISVTASSTDAVEVFSTSDYFFQDKSHIRKPGRYESVCRLPAKFLNTGRYSLEIAVEVPMERELFKPQIMAFDVGELGHNQMGPINAAKPAGVLHPELEWKVRRTRALQDSAA